MKRVAEIIHIVESERENFLKNALNPSAEELEVLWTCGVRKQQYFALHDLLFMTFEYAGHDFSGDMRKMAAYLDSKGLLVRDRRRDIPADELETRSWWAPVKRLGSLLDSKPASMEDDNYLKMDYSEMLQGYMREYNESGDTAFDEDDWTTDIRI